MPQRPNPHPPSLREGDFPAVGAQRQGWILACRGEDCIDDFEPFVGRHAGKAEQLLQVAEVTGTRLPFEDLTDFLEKIGVALERTAFERETCTGVGILGWFRSGSKKAISTAAHGLLEQSRDAICQTLKDNDFDALLLLGSQEEQLARMRNALQAVQSEHDALRSAHEALSGRPDPAVDRALLDLLIAVHAEQPANILAGPLVLWQGRAVYAIVKVGDKELPQDCNASRVLDHLKDSGLEVSELNEQTAIYAGPRGLVYAKGPSTPEEWRTIWRTGHEPWGPPTPRGKKTFVNVTDAEQKDIDAIRAWLITHQTARSQ